MMNSGLDHSCERFGTFVGLYPELGEQIGEGEGQSGEEWRGECSMWLFRGQFLSGRVAAVLEAIAFHTVKFRIHNPIFFDPVLFIEIPLRRSSRRRVESGKISTMRSGGLEYFHG